MRVGACKNSDCEHQLTGPSVHASSFIATNISLEPVMFFIVNVAPLPLAHQLKDQHLTVCKLAMQKATKFEAADVPQDGAECS